jgi:hypothetical protein
MTIFEVRVEGQLAGPTLHSLGCAHCVAEAQTLMRIDATPTYLNAVLKACSDHGLTIESIVRLDPPRPDPDVSPDFSRDRGRVPGGPRPLDG